MLSCTTVICEQILHLLVDTGFLQEQVYILPILSTSQWHLTRCFAQRRMNERTSGPMDKHIDLEGDAHASPFGLGYIEKDDNHRKTLPGSVSQGKVCCGVETVWPRASDSCLFSSPLCHWLVRNRW